MNKPTKATKRAREEPDSGKSAKKKSKVSAETVRTKERKRASLLPAENVLPQDWQAPPKPKRVALLNFLDAKDQEVLASIYIGTNDGKTVSILSGHYNIFGAFVFNINLFRSP